MPMYTPPRAGLLPCPANWLSRVGFAGNPTVPRHAEDLPFVDLQIDAVQSDHLFRPQFINLSQVLDTDYGFQDDPSPHNTKRSSLTIVHRAFTITASICNISSFPGRISLPLRDAAAVGYLTPQVGNLLFPHVLPQREKGPQEKNCYRFHYSILGPPIQFQGQGKQKFCQKKKDSL